MLAGDRLLAAPARAYLITLPARARRSVCRRCYPWRRSFRPDPCARRSPLRWASPPLPPKSSGL